MDPAIGLPTWRNWPSASDRTGLPPRSDGVRRSTTRVSYTGAGGDESPSRMITRPVITSTSSDTSQSSTAAISSSSIVTIGEIVD